MRLTQSKFKILQDINKALLAQKFSLRVVFYDDKTISLSSHRILSYDKNTYLIKSIQLISDEYDEVILESDSTNYFLTRFYVILRLYEYKHSKIPVFDFSGDKNISVTCLN